MTKEQILQKLTSLCAKSEYCKEDMYTKMRRWGIDNDMQSEVIDYLEKERYIDECRYTEIFIRNKIKYNKWGKKKIEQALFMKRIPRSVYAPLLTEVDSSEYTDTLTNILKQKIKTIKTENKYEQRGKLIRYALQKGFSMDDIMRCIDNIVSE